MRIIICKQDKSPNEQQIFVRQPVNTQLAQKYDKKFNFFFAKPISEIVLNHTIASATLDYKDIVVYSEANEYLKRLYHIKNNAGRNQIYDRIRMLADFYCGAAMLKYEHPMMILTKTKDVFLKRIKRMKKMIASDCSSQQSSEQKSQHSSQIQSFSSSQFLRTIKTSQLDQSSEQLDDSLIKNCGKKQKSYDSEVHDIYEKSTLNFSESEKLKPNQIKQAKIKDRSEVGLEHLILDIDDVDKEKVVKQYKKVQQRDNIRDGNSKKQEKLKKSSIIITALDNYVPADKQSQSSGAQNYYPKNSKYMKKQPFNNRYKEEDDETIRLYNYNFGSSHNYQSKNFKQGNANRSPSFGTSHNFERKSTQRNLMSSPSYISLSNQYQPLGDQKRLSKDRISSQFSKFNQKQSPNQLLVPYQESETIYITQENSVSSKVQKKQYIRDKAAALLHKVKSQQKLPLFYEEDPRSTLKFQPRNRATKFQ